MHQRRRNSDNMFRRRINSSLVPIPEEEICLFGNHIYIVKPEKRIESAINPKQKQASIELSSKKTSSQENILPPIQERTTTVKTLKSALKRSQVENAAQKLPNIEIPRSSEENQTIPPFNGLWTYIKETKDIIGTGKLPTRGYRNVQYEILSKQTSAFQESVKNISASQSAKFRKRYRRVSTGSFNMNSASLVTRGKSLYRY